MRNLRKLSFLLIAVFVLSLAAVAADTYTIDNAHSAANFAVRHMMISTVHGRFTAVSGTIVFDPSDLSKCSVTATILTSTITTDNATRDKHLNSADFFETAKYPEIKFVSSGVRKAGENQYVAVGNLTIKDVTKQIELPFTLATGEMKGQKRLGVEGHLKIDRTDYHVNYDPTGLGVAKEVNIEIDVEAAQNK